jgi:putative Holliday junction resolvase
VRRGLPVYCLALDVGERRTGVAIGEVLSRPLTTLKRRSKEQDFAAIARLIREHRVDTLVVGLPLNMDGSRGFQAQKTERYALELKHALLEMGLAVALVLWDERMTTEEADRAMIDGEQGFEDRRRRVDAVAAAIILQSYLDRQGQLNWCASGDAE